MSERPPVDEIQKVHVMDDEEHEKPFVEVFMQIHKNGQAVEPLTAEFFPHGRPEDLDSPPRIARAPADEPCVRLLQPEVLSDAEMQRYRVFSAVVGRLAYHEP